MRWIPLLFAIGCAAQEGPIGVNEVGSDWVEVFNAEDTSGDVEGWTIRSEGGTTATLTGTLSAGEVRQIALDMPFGMMTVEDAAGEIVQQIEVPTLDEAMSFGRIPDGSANWQVIDMPSPGALNGG